MEILGIAVDAFGTLFGSFNAYEIQKLRGTLNQFVSKQNILAQVTVKHEKEFKLMHEILSYLLQTVQTLAKQDTQVVNLVLADQMDILEDRLETAITAIQTLHDKKLAVDFLTHDQLVALYDAVNKTATN